MKKILTLNNLFLLTVFCLPLYLIRVGFFGFPSNVLELLAAGVIIATVIKNPPLWKKLFALPKFLLFSCALMLVGVLLSILSNDNQIMGLGILKGWFLIPLLFSFFLYTTFHSKFDLERMFWSTYLSSAFVGAVAIIYKFTGITTYDNRLTAFYLSPNHLAMYLSAGIFFGAYFLLKAFEQKESSKTYFLHFLLLTVIVAPLYYTYSYGSWVAVFISFGVILFSVITSKKKLAMLLLFLLLIAALIFSFQKNTDKFSTFANFSERSSLASRQTIWKVSLLLVSENPLVGIGPGNFQSAYLSKQQNFPPYLEWAVPQPHNVFLAFWLQAGLSGLVGFLFLLYFVFRTLWHVSKNNKGVTLATPLLGFFLYFVLHGMIDTPYWKNDLSFLFWICVFLSLSVFNFSKEKN
ncbi:MAG: hypothetical protein ACD_67C00116G0002 [uncultured bacterium]|nr:MAG: hypothetical protein ACD_67C00116G0002 [uncultured bacterium]